MKKSAAIVYVNDTTAQVTKAFQKNAVIFGTDEFKLWREYLTYFPNAKMTTKSIKKNTNKKTRRNLTFANMVEYMKTQENSEDLLAEFETMKSRSKIQASPYQYSATQFCEACWYSCRCTPSTTCGHRWSGAPASSTL